MPLAILALTLLAATAAGLLWRRRDGALRAEPVDGAVLSFDDVAAAGGTAGSRATLVQFSSSFCAPCRATRQILADVAGMVEGVSYVEIDAEAHLDVVRRHRVLRTPTTMVLDAAGRIVVRASGQPRKADVIAALGRALDQSTTTSPTP
ncbi:MAG: thioredoxin family protein [Mycobacteriales bacterium]